MTQHDHLAGTKPGPGIRALLQRWRRPGARLLLAVVIACACVCDQHCAAREPFAEFLRALEKRGYGEQGLAYVDSIAERPDLPADLKETLELERSKFLRAAAGEAYDPQQRSGRLAESKRLAEKFIAEHPAHPAAGTLLLADGDDALARGERLLAMARGTREKELHAKALQDAQAALSEARASFEVAARRLKERLDSFPEPAKETDKPDAEAKRQQVALPWVEARCKIALCEYFTAQTITEPKDKKRAALLDAAGKAFDAVYQEYRGRHIGLLAHMWHGKALEDMDDTQSALENYDEVLAVAPEGNDADPEHAPLFGQAQLFRLQAMQKQATPAEIIKEGELWLQAHKKWNQASLYQGIALEVVRARLKAVDQFRLGSERTKALRECVVALNTIGKIESEFRHEALLLRRDVVAKMGTAASLSVPELLALGDESAAERNWAEAATYYHQAIESAGKGSETKSADTAKKRLPQVLYRQAADYYAAHNMERALTICGELVRDFPDAAQAEEASAVAIAAALALHTEAPADKKAITKQRLERVTTFALGHWPSKAVADDARMALAQVALSINDYQAAEQRLSEVSRQSNRYATALHVLGQVRWKQYLTAKKSAGEGASSDLASLRSEAVEFLRMSLDQQKASWQSSSEPMPPALFDTQLFLAETCLEGARWAEASLLLKPLVEVMKQSQPTTVEQSGQRTLVGAIRARLNTGELPLVGEAADLLIKISHDEEQTNSVLVELTKLVGQEARKVEPPAAVAADATQPGAPASMLHDLQTHLIEALASRTALSIQQLMYLGDACVQLGKNDQAKDLYQRLLARVDQDDSAKAAAGAAITGVRARFVRILRNEGKLDEAERQANALLKEYPNALEPLMEKGYILQSLAERDPNRYDECVAHWTNIRVRLGQSKSRPPEYYDVLYNTALCLVHQARASGDKTKAMQAEQLLKSTLTLNPALNGPETVMKFDALLKQASRIRETPSTAATSAVKH